MSGPIQRADRRPALFSEANNTGVIDLSTSDAVAPVTPEVSAGLLGCAQNYFANNPQSNLKPAEQRELVNTLDEVKREEPYIWSYDDPKTGRAAVTSVVEHSLLGSTSLAMKIGQLLGFPASDGAIQRILECSGKVFCCAFNYFKLPEKHASVKYDQMFEMYAPLSNPQPEYDPPKSKEFSGPCRSRFWEKNSRDQIEKDLSFKRRALSRIVSGVMYVDGKPYNPAFDEIFVPSSRPEYWRHATWDAKGYFLVYAYKVKDVAITEVEAYTNTLKKGPPPLYTIPEQCQRIETYCKEHPIRMVDLHQLSHLLEARGYYGFSSACVEQEWMVDGKKRDCTMIVLRNDSELVKQRYQELWEKYSSSLKNRETYDPKMAPNTKDPQQLKKHLSSQKELLEKSIEAMHIDGETFDPLFEKIEVLSVEDRIAAGYPLSDIAKRDIIRFVYREVENDPPAKHPVENICARIEEIALSKEIQPTTGSSSLFGFLSW